jgi:indolepyruvate ferredoxin oxidoreductase, alpha subunit
MPERVVNGDEALAFGALVAGVRLVASYPGSPSSGTVEALTGLAERHGVYVEWSSNEKVAAEMAIGASIAGRRALVCAKSVGMNAMLDPLMTLNLTPIHGGLVILLGDDPGGYGSQNDQDTRPLAPMLEMPMLEPATPAEGFAMVRAAFDAAETLRMPVIVRVTRSCTQQEERLDVPEGPYRQPDLGLCREPWRFVPVPRNVVEKHRGLHERLAAAGRWVESLPFNRIVGSGTQGIVGAGFAFRKLLDVLGDEERDGLRLLKLGALHPLPEGVVVRFLSACQRVLVVEENEPFLEIQLRALAQSHDLRARILGKQTGHVAREGELFRWQIQEALGGYLPGFVPAREYRREGEADERPRREGHCVGCRFDKVLDALRQAADGLGQETILVGDPGCLAAVGDRLDAKYALGSAVGVADGLSKAGIPGRAVALFGDSSFFHSALSAVCNAAVNRSEILMVVLDNGATVTSGFQPNPGVGRDALGRPAPALDIERIARACGVEFVRGIGPDDLDARLPALFREALAHRGLALAVVRTPCGPPAAP